MSTIGHENEAINVQGLKASLQKFKDEAVPKSTAGNVVGEFSDTGAEFAYRPTAGAVDIESGQADYGGRLERVKGNTIAWNQLLDMNKNWSTSNCTYTRNNNIITATKTGEANANCYTGLTKTNVVGHKYIRFATIKSETINSVAWNTGGSYKDVPLTTGSWNRIKDIFGATANYSYFVFYFDGSIGDEISFKEVMHIDLTLIYGEGNEPTTVEQFEADYMKWFGKPLTYEEYDEGSLRNVKMTGIKTVGFNLWDEEWELGWIDGDGIEYFNNGRIRAKNYNSIIPNEQYHINNGTGKYMWFYVYDANKNIIDCVKNISTNGTYNTPSNAAFFRLAVVEMSTYNHDICINLHHSGDRDGEYEPYWESTLNVPITTLKGKLNGAGTSVVIFPDGMKKAGTVYDEIVRRGDKTYAIKRVGSVDMGTLEWTLISTRFYANVNNIKVYQAHRVTPMLCPIYETKMNGEPYDASWNKVIYNSGGDKNVIVTDASYSDAALLKTALDGVILYYELATYEEYLLDDFELPQNYDVDDYGTEEILLGTNGVAPVLDLKYGINAGDTIKNLPHSYVSAVGEQNFTDAQKARARKNIGAAEELSEDLKEMPEVASEALTDIYQALDGMRENFKNLGECKATCIDSEEIPKVCGGPLVIEGAGAPAAPNVPVFVGQRYHDKTNKKVYEAFSVTNSISDWVLLN